MQTYNGQLPPEQNTDHSSDSSNLFLSANNGRMAPSQSPAAMMSDQSLAIDNMLRSLQNDTSRTYTSSSSEQNTGGYSDLPVGMFPMIHARPSRSTPSLTPSYAAQPALPGHLHNSNPKAGGEKIDWRTEHLEQILNDMPKKEEDQARHAMFTEFIKLKTRSLELEIAQAQQKAKEAELELLKWKDVSARKLSLSQDQGGPNPVPSALSSTIHDIQNGGNYASYDNSSTMTNGQINMATRSFPNMPRSDTPNGSGMNPPTPMTNFDFESLQAMAFDSGIENLFSFLDSNQQGQSSQQSQPSMQNGNQAMQGNGSGTVDPSNMYLNNLDTPFFPTSDFGGTPIMPTQPILSPTKRLHSPLSDTEATSPAVKRSKRTIEKKVVVERMATCPGCSKIIGRILFRALKDRIPEDISIDLKCTDCAGVHVPSTLPDPATAGNATTTVGTVEMRKRLRATLDLEDEEKKELVRRQWCDVCQRVVASGRLIGGEKENMSPIAEIICALCDGRYQRCTDCGGGGGPRVGIGKWRMKQVFPPGRKTCSLSHNRIGDRPRELGVHVTPTDFNSQQMKEVLHRTKGLWNEKTLARLAVPEMLEIDLPPDVINPLKDYADVEDIVTRNWPTREAMIRAEGADSNRFKRLLGLIWAHPRSRRAVRTVDLEEEEHNKTADDDEGDMSTVLDNVKRTNVVIPPGSELVNMWGGEWDIENGSLLISTLIPFEGADGDDSTALSVGEMITKVQSLRQKMNDEEIARAQRECRQANIIPQCEHLWVVSAGTMPLVREKIAEVLTKKRSFVPVEEYLTRHPEFIHALKARPVGLHPDLHKPVLSVKDGKEGLEEIESRPLILVRWLGRDFDQDKVREIKLQEFGGKAKSKKKAAAGGKGKSG